jgi:hypothetical protein
MKAIKFLLAIAMLMIFTISAKPQAASFEVNNATMKTYYVIDTVTNSTGVTITYPYLIPAGWGYIVQVVADSLSGSTAGTFSLQTSAGQLSTKVYKTITSGTATINGVQSVAIFEPAANLP